MKTIIAITILCLSLRGSAQRVTVDALKSMVLQQVNIERDEEAMEEFDSAMQEVINDYYKTGYQLYYNGSLSPSYHKILQNEYKVSLRDSNPGDYPMAYYKYLYNCGMEALLKQQYGWNILQKILVRSQKQDAEQGIISLDSLVKLAEAEIQDFKPMADRRLYLYALSDTMVNPYVVVSAALSDFKSGKICMYNEPFGLSRTQQQVLFANYGVCTYQDTGRNETVLAYQYFYNAAMRVLLKEKYGWNLFQKVLQEALRMDANGTGSRMAAYVGGHDAMQKFIYCRLNYFDVKPVNGVYPQFQAQITIDTAGKLLIQGVGNIYPREDPSRKFRKYRREIRRVFEQMPAWQPATQEGKAVPFNMTVQINFSPEMKEKLKCE